METLLTFFNADFLGTPAWSWLLFLGIVVTLLAFDLGVLHRENARSACAKACCSRPATSPPR